MVGIVANEEGMGEEITFNPECGILGGIPLGPNFGSALNADANFPMSQMFDFYNGGGLDSAFLGFFAEVNPMGDINVSHFAGAFAGCGGFIDISQPTKRVFRRHSDLWRFGGIGKRRKARHRAGRVAEKVY